MTIGNIYDMGHIQSIYTFGNARYPSENIGAVTPVKPINSLKPLTAETDRLRTVVTYDSESGTSVKADELRAARQDEKIRAEYGGFEQVEYNLSNPYENQRMTTEGIFLAGMNFDMLA